MIIYSFTNNRNDFYFLPKDINLKIKDSSSLQDYDLKQIFSNYKIIKITDIYPFIIKNCHYVIKLSKKRALNFMIRREFKYSRYLDKHYNLIKYDNYNGILMYSKGIDLTRLNVISLSLWKKFSNYYIHLLDKGIVHGDIKLDNLCITPGLKDLYIKYKIYYKIYLIIYF